MIFGNNIRDYKDLRVNAFEEGDVDTEHDRTRIFLSWLGS